MKVDQVFSWTGGCDGRGRWQSQCWLRIYHPHPEATVVIVSDIPNAGTSITNAAARLAKLVVKEFRISPKEMVWIEQYPHWRNSSTPAAEFSLVSFDWLKDDPTKPTWACINIEKVRHLTEDKEI